MDEDDAKRFQELETQSEQGREKQKKQVEKLLSSVSDLLLLFSGDGRLTYPVDETGEQFALDPKRRTVTVPSPFLRGSPFTRRIFSSISTRRLPCTRTMRRTRRGI